jgi:hypothetical protein
MARKLTVREQGSVVITCKTEVPSAAAGHSGAPA